MGEQIQWHKQRFTPSPRKIEIACAECGQKMWLPASKVTEYQRCGPACNAAWRAAKRAARMRNCETCGKNFMPRTRQIRLGHGRFCSQRCNAAVHTAGNRPENRKKAWATRRAKHHIEGSPPA